MRAGHFHCILNRFRAGGDKHGLFGKITRRAFVQPLGQGDIAFKRRDVETGVGELLRLIRNRLHHFRVPVAGVVDRNPCGKVDIALTLGIPQFSVFGARGIDTTGGDTLRHGCGPARFQIFSGVHHGPSNGCGDSGALIAHSQGRSYRKATDLPAIRGVRPLPDSCDIRNLSHGAQNAATLAVCTARTCVAALLSRCR